MPRENPRNPVACRHDVTPVWHALGALLAVACLALLLPAIARAGDAKDHARTGKWRSSQAATAAPAVPRKTADNAKLKWKRPHRVNHDDHVRPAAFTGQPGKVSAKPRLPKTKNAVVDAPALLGPIHDEVAAHAAFQDGAPSLGAATTEDQQRDLLAKAPPTVEEPCPDPDELKPIDEITNDISAEAGEFPPECDLGNETYEPRQWAMTTYTWKASGLCHKPLYFEEVGLERYGHSAGPILQPLISGAHFFATVPILPYKMGIEPPGECVYDLGYYRPGSCAPRIILPIGLSLRGALFEAGAATGLAFLIP